MKGIGYLRAGILCCLIFAGCGASSDNQCTINALVTPSNATADHNAAAPGNQVQFSTTSTVTGNCPLIADTKGSWSTSDPANTTVSNQAPTEGLATCLNATPRPATISTSGTVRGHTFTPAKLTCR